MKLATIILGASFVSEILVLVAWHALGLDVEYTFPRLLSIEWLVESRLPAPTWATLMEPIILSVLVWGLAWGLLQDVTWWREK